MYRFALVKCSKQQNLLYLHLPVCRPRSLTLNRTSSTVSAAEAYLHKFLSCSQSLQSNPFLECFSDTYPETLSTNTSHAHPDTETHALVIRAESGSREISQWLSTGSESIQQGFHTATCPQTIHTHSSSLLATSFASPELPACYEVENPGSRNRLTPAAQLASRLLFFGGVLSIQPLLLSLRVRAAGSKTRSCKSACH